MIRSYHHTVFDEAISFHFKHHFNVYNHSFSVSFYTGFLFLQEIIVVGIIPEYFDKYYNVAIAVISCGAGISIIVMPPLTQKGLDIYGWRGTLLLLSGLCIQSIPCAALISRGSRDKQASAPLLSITRSSHSQNREDESRPTIVSCSLLTTLPFISDVLIPSFVFGYIFNGWVIYIVSFAFHNGLSISEASAVSTCGGIGITVNKIVFPLLNNLMTYKQIMYMSSILGGITLTMNIFVKTFTGLCILSVLFGAGFCVIAAEIFIAAKEVTTAGEFLNAVAWVHMMQGVGAIASGFITGTKHGIYYDF